MPAPSLQLQVLLMSAHIIAKPVLFQLQLGQVLVPKDTVVHINLWGMQHDEQYWQDAEAFKPERWLGDKTGGDKSGGMAYMPFGLGPRMCIGIKLACESSLCTLAVMLLTCVFSSLADLVRSLVTGVVLVLE